MRKLVPFSLCFLLAAATGAFAQRGGMGGGFRGGFGGGSRGGVGGGFRGGLGGGFRGGFGGGGFGGFRGGFGGGGFGGFRGGFIGGGLGRGFAGHRFAGRIISGPFFFNRFNRFGFFNGALGYPLFWGGYDWGWPSYDGGYYPYAAQPNVTVVYPEQSYPAQVVASQPETAHPVMRECCSWPSGSVGPPSPPASHSELYLLAFKDGVIRAALAYWVEDGTLHYVGTDHKSHETPLRNVDRDFSMQLNRERRVPFRLPEQ